MSCEIGSGVTVRIRRATYLTTFVVESNESTNNLDTTLFFSVSTVFLVAYVGHPRRFLCRSLCFLRILPSDPIRDETSVSDDFSMWFPRLWIGARRAASNGAACAALLRYPPITYLSL